MPEHKAPRITKALLDWVDSLWPDRAPRGDESERDVWIHAGAVSVVRRLKVEAERQKGTE